MPKTETDPEIIVRRKKARDDYQRRYYQAHKEKAKEYQRHYMLKHKRPQSTRRGMRGYREVAREFRPSAYSPQALIKLPVEKIIVIVSRIVRGETQLIRSTG